jgi:hypothetical protein
MPRRSSPRHHGRHHGGHHGRHHGRHGRRHGRHHGGRYGPPQRYGYGYPVDTYLAPIYYPLPYADYHEYDGSCMTEGVKEMHFLDNTCESFAIGPQCCDGYQRQLVEGSCLNLSDDKSIGTVQCVPEWP